MSTQTESGIEFSVVTEDNRQHFRLLELPPDLLSLITSDHPPILQLKSAEGPPGYALESNAVLCTPDKTYNLRQVSTSNEVYVAQPSSISDDGLAQPGLEAIAKLESTLEIQLARPGSATPYVKSVLPTYTTTGHYESRNSMTKQQLFANIPVSDNECEQAWRQLACFETQESGSTMALIPSNGVKLKIWQAIVISATATGIDFTHKIDPHDISTLVIENDEWPTELVPALLASMAAEPDTTSGIGLDKTKCPRVVGEILLREQTESGKKFTNLDMFISAWADLLPESWRAQADLSLLEGSHRLDREQQEITFVEEDAGKEVAMNGSALAETKSNLGAKRKWHEKFRASKKTA